jgi:hypothetical protein
LVVYSRATLSVLPAERRQEIREIILAAIGVLGLLPELYLLVQKKYLLPWRFL